MRAAAAASDTLMPRMTPRFAFDGDDARNAPRRAGCTRYA
jgi:hypothetical protein